VAIIFFAISTEWIWFDESFSLALVKHPLKDIILLTATDVHPPLYYLILKTAVVLFGDPIYIAKLVSAFPIMLTLIFSVLFLKKNFSDKAAILFIFCFMASQDIICYSAEIRMYSWALLFVTMAAIAAGYIISTQKMVWWGVFLFCAECAAYTHYYAGVTVGIGYLLLLCYIIKFDRKKKIIPALLVALLCLLLYLPWILIAARQFSTFSDNTWISSLTIHDISLFVLNIFSVGYFRDQQSILSKDSILSFLFITLFLCLFVRFLIRKNKTQKDFIALYGLGSVALLHVFGVSISLLIRPMFLFRYVIPVYGLVWLFFAIEGSLIKSKKIFIGLNVVIFVFGCIVFRSLFSLQREKNEEFKTFHSCFVSQINPNDILVYEGNSFLDFYMVSYLFPKHPMMMMKRDTDWSYYEVYDKIFEVNFIAYSELFNSDKFKNSRILRFMNASDEYEDRFSKEGNVVFCGSFRIKKEKPSIFCRPIEK
jgi:4-amino-4-deoxy-L-arabinose transferase-like glycosyltransferase